LYRPLHGWTLVLFHQGQDPDATIVMLACASLTSSSDRNRAKSDLLSPRARNACHFIGNGTDLPSITLRTGRAFPFDRRDRVVALMECFR
jgi:hypothetical protein